MNYLYMHGLGFSEKEALHDISSQKSSLMDRSSNFKVLPELEYRSIICKKYVSNSIK